MEGNGHDEQDEQLASLLTSQHQYARSTYLVGAGVLTSRSVWRKSGCPGVRARLLSAQPRAALQRAQKHLGVLAALGVMAAAHERRRQGERALWRLGTMLVAAVIFVAALVLMGNLRASLRAPSVSRLVPSSYVQQQQQAAAATLAAEFRKRKSPRATEAAAASVPTQTPLQGVQAEVAGQGATCVRCGPRNSGLGADAEWLKRREEVVAAFRRTWAAYRRTAWGADELKPLSERGADGFGLGLMIVDSLDTALLMGLDDEYKQGAEWVANSMNVKGRASRDKVSLFETTIRALGGLLSAYELSGEAVLLERARQLADRLMPAFEKSPSAIPFPYVDLTTGAGEAPAWNGRHSSVAEAGTLVMEWATLSALTGEKRYRQAAERAEMRLLEQHEGGFAAGVFVSVGGGNAKRDGHVTLGPMADSYYEYLPKFFALQGKAKGAERYHQAFKDTVKAVEEQLVSPTNADGASLIGELWRGEHRGFIDHLVCFYPGTLAFAVSAGIVDARHLETAKNVTAGCYKHFYEKHATGLAPEELTWTSTHVSSSGKRTYRLRPETAESLFYLWRATRDEQYREWGWRIFQSIEKHARLPGDKGYATVRDVNQLDARNHKDECDTFFTGETLKYLYLLLSPDDLLPLGADDGEWVFNTEAHPFRVRAGQ